MGINFVGAIDDAPRIKIGYIGCGSHSRRNVLPALKFASVETEAICDLNYEKAQAYAAHFGFKKAYANHIEMLEKEELDAVCIVTGYGEYARPLYPSLARDCVERGCHVWIEKPPAASSEELIELKKLADAKGKKVLVGFKKMFFPANEKAKELSQQDYFGGIAMATLQYPLDVPKHEDIVRYINKEHIKYTGVVSFLDHLCHPVSLLVYLMGYPENLFYMRTNEGLGMVNFTFPDGTIASIAMTQGQSKNGGMERTQLFAKIPGTHISVENNIKVSLHRTPPNIKYGSTPSFYTGTANDATAVWEPEFSLGQLYNKGLFLLGYYGEIEVFAQAVINDTPLPKSGLDDAIVITKIFEAFAHGPGKIIKI